MLYDLRSSVVFGWCVFLSFFLGVWLMSLYQSFSIWRKKKYSFWLISFIYVTVCGECVPSVYVLNRIHNWPDPKCCQEQFPKLHSRQHHNCGWWILHYVAHWVTMMILICWKGVIFGGSVYLCCPQLTYTEIGFLRFYEIFSVLWVWNFIIFLWWRFSIFNIVFHFSFSFPVITRNIFLPIHNHFSSVLCTLCYFLKELKLHFMF